MLRLIKYGFLLRLLFWSRSILPDFLKAALAVLLVLHVHSEYLTWASLVNHSATIAISFVIKNLSLAAIIAFCFFRLKQKTSDPLPQQKPAMEPEEFQDSESYSRLDGMID